MMRKEAGIESTAAGVKLLARVVVEETSVLEEVKAVPTVP
jgi:hypothetical protein